MEREQIEVRGRLTVARAHSAVVMMAAKKKFFSQHHCVSEVMTGVVLLGDQHSHSGEQSRRGGGTPQRCEQLSKYFADKID